MNRLTRHEFEGIVDHLDLPVNELDRLLHNEVYPDQAAWSRAARYFLLGLGALFILSGLVMFFAFNWQVIPKFAKFTALQIGVIATAALYFNPRFSPLTKKTSLMASAILIGVMFAVYGQIYQTGADAYELFVTWTLAITLITIVLSFLPLWLFYIALVNLAITLYFKQTLAYDDINYHLLTLSMINSAIIAGIIGIETFKKTEFPLWFKSPILLLTAITCIFSAGITLFSSTLATGNLLIILALIIVGLIYSFLAKELFFQTITLFSSLVIGSFIMIHFVIKSGQFELGFFFVLGLYYIFGTIWIAYYLLNQRKGR